MLARARAAGLTTIVSNGLNPDDNEAVLALAARDPLVRPALGLYPVDAVLAEMRARGDDYPGRQDAVDPAEAVAWLRAHADQAVAIGEIGLDHYWVPEALWAAQERVFCTIVELAMAADKPIIVHTRKAELRTLELLIELRAPRVIWHCFSSKVKLGERIAAQGHYLSIPATVRKAQNFSHMLDRLPRDRVLLETDCPYLAPDSGELNEPANVTVTASYAAERWGCPLSEVQTQLERNFAAIFGFEA